MRSTCQPLRRSARLLGLLLLVFVAACGAPPQDSAVPSSAMPAGSVPVSAAPSSAVPDDRCLSGGIYDYSGSEPGAASPAEAVQRLHDGRQRQVDMERDQPQTPERIDRTDDDKDAIAGLEALLPVAARAVGAGELTAVDATGRVVATATITPAPAGGFVVEQLGYLSSRATC